MRDERHTSRYRGVLAVGGRDNDRVKSERHCERAYEADINEVRYIGYVSLDEKRKSAKAKREYYKA